MMPPTAWVTATREVRCRTMGLRCWTRGMLRIRRTSHILPSMEVVGSTRTGAVFTTAETVIGCSTVEVVRGPTMIEVAGCS